MLSSYLNDKYKAIISESCFLFDLSFFSLRPINNLSVI